MKTQCATLYPDRCLSVALSALKFPAGKDSAVVRGRCRQPQALGQQCDQSRQQQCAAQYKQMQVYRRSQCFGVINAPGQKAREYTSFVGAGASHAMNR